MSRPITIEAIINLGVEQYRSGNFSEAIKTYQSGLILEGNNALLYYDLLHIILYIRITNCMHVCAYRAH